MKVRVSFDVDKETRAAIAREIDGKQWAGRLATRHEIEGKICDGAEESLTVVTAYYGDELRALATEDET